MDKNTERAQFIPEMPLGSTTNISSPRIDPQIIKGVCYSKGPDCQKTCAQPSGVEEVTNCSTHYAAKPQRY